MAIHTAANGWTYTDEQWHKYFSMRDSEVRSIFNAASTKLLTTMNLGFSEKMDAQSTCAAIDAIWTEKKRREETASLRKKAFDEMVNAAYIKLKAAHTPNGQLIASILEDEDGKTAEELKGWCDELLSLEDSEYQKLLDDLVDDGILLKEDDRYHVMRVCTNDMDFDSKELMRRWAYYVFGKYEQNAGGIKWGEKPAHFRDRYEFVLDRFCTCEPFYPEISQYEAESLVAISKGFIKKPYIVGELDAFVECGILKKENEGVLAGCYRIPLLGE